MKNAIKILGIIALAAIIGFSMAACGDGDDGGGSGGGKIPSGLVATWYRNEECTSFAFTIKSDGKMSIGFGTFAISANNDTITLTEYNPVRTVKYALDGKELTFSDHSWTSGGYDVTLDVLFAESVYYKE